MILLLFSCGEPSDSKPTQDTARPDTADTDLGDDTAVDTDPEDTDPEDTDPEDTDDTHGDDTAPVDTDIALPVTELCPSPTVVTGGLRVTDAAGLEALCASEQVVVVGNVTFAWADDTAPFESVPCLCGVTGDLQIEGDHGMTAYADFPLLTDVEGMLAVTSTTHITEVGGLRNVLSVGSLYIYGNDLLTDLSGLGSANVRDAFTVSYNDALLTLDGERTHARGGGR